MQLPKTISENLFFLISETKTNVSNLQNLLETPSLNIANRLLDRQGYAYNLMARIQEDCVQSLKNTKKNNVNVFSLRAAQSIASDFVRLTLMCHDCAKMLKKITRSNTIQNRESIKILNEVKRALYLIQQTIETTDTKIILKIDNIEKKIDRAYDRFFQTYLKDFNKGANNKNERIITSILVAHRIEEMGDILYHIAETIMSAQIGQPMKIERYKSLQMLLDDFGLAHANIETVAETKSGSAIAGVSDPNRDEEGYLAIFKDGSKSKLEEEIESVESWHDIFPGLAPQILSYEKRGKNAAILIEHLNGATFENILRNASDDIFSKAQKKLSKTLKAVWQETKKKKKVPANHMEQLIKRLPSVFEIHPRFNFTLSKIHKLIRPSLLELIESCKKLEETLTPPFSVYIHGDFNLDNIIFDPERRKIHFIDLHRSAFQDYTQDVSVFMVSGYRLQVLDHKTRDRIKENACFIYDVAKSFALKNNDETFDLRLGLGLARSFITSTRFILDQELSQQMFLRAVFIMERLAIYNQNDLKPFTLQIEDIFS